MTRRNKAVDVFLQIDMRNGNKDECWPWKGGHTGEGRPQFNLNGKKVLPYRLVYELVHGVVIPPNVLYRHICDVKTCCNPWHGIPGTHQENMDDMVNRERHGLPHHAVRAIKNLLAKGDTHESIAEKFGVDRSTIGRIARGEAYSTVK